VPLPDELALAASAARSGLPSFLGSGLLRPFRRDEKNDFASGSGADLVAACVGQVLGTRASGPSGVGELPWRPEFGSADLNALRHAQNDDALADLGVVYVGEALRRWEPRARVTRVTPRRPTPETLVLDVRFDVVDRSGRVLARGLSVTATVGV
jgi:phage baseplate assembly protein W